MSWCSPIISNSWGKNSLNMNVVTTPTSTPHSNRVKFSNVMVGDVGGVYALLKRGIPHLINVSWKIHVRSVISGLISIRVLVFKFQFILCFLFVLWLERLSCKEWWTSCSIQIVAITMIVVIIIENWIVSVQRKILYLGFSWFFGQISTTCIPSFAF